MNENDKPRFKIAIAALAEALDYECPATRQKTYWLLFGHVSIESFESACEQAMRTLRWFPKPAELFEIINGSATDRAEAAWLLAEREVLRVGYRRSPAIDCPVTIAAIESCGGWERFCSVPEKEVPFVKRDFLKAFGAFVHAPPRVVQPLIGEVDRLRDRLPKRGPVRIGELTGEVLRIR